MVNLKRYEIGFPNQLKNPWGPIASKDGEWVKFKDVVAQNSTSHNKAMRAISFRAKNLISKVRNGMSSSTIHDIRDILATVAETAS